jgi:hypothetical protein
MRLFPGSRAFVLTASLAIATTASAGAPAVEEATEGPAAAPAVTTVEEKKVEKFMPSINVGPAAGYAEQDGGDFGWEAQVLARLHPYAGIQLEYWSLGNHRPSGGHFDGLYVGVMPMFPVWNGLNIFGQIGGAFSDYGNDVAGGGGLLYHLPISFLNENNVDLLLRLDYKYFAIGNEDDKDSGQHLIALGFMVGFHK